MNMGLYYGHVLGALYCDGKIQMKSKEWSHFEVLAPPRLSSPLLHELHPHCLAQPESTGFTEVIIVRAERRGPQHH